MFNIAAKTMYQCIVDNQFKEFANMYPEGISTISNVLSQESMKEHSIISVDPTKQSVQNLISNSSYCSLEGGETHHYRDFFKDVTNRILTVDGEHTYQEAINIILPFIEKAGNNFYGALLRKGNKIINPFNIASILHHINNEYQDKFTVILYFYQNRPDMDKQYKSYLADIDAMTVNIESLIKCKAAVVESTMKISAAIQDQKNGRITIDSYIQVPFSTLASSSAIRSETYVMAHQAITEGVVAPYYSASVLTKEPTGSATGIYASPFLCANISNNSGVPSREDQANFGSVCTGSLPNNQIKGLTSLTICNMLSPYKRNIITSGALIYADMCINKCLEIYSKVGYITDYTPISISTEDNKPFEPTGEQIVAYFTFKLDSDDLDLFNQIEAYIQSRGITYDKYTNTLTTPNPSED